MFLCVHEDQPEKISRRKAEQAITEEETLTSPEKEITEDESSTTAEQAVT